MLDAHEYEGHVSTVIPQQRASERRDVHRTIDLWQRNVTADSVLPLLSTFDFSSMKSNWGHRFLICSDPNVENAAFMMYGAKFAQLLDLPEKVRTIIPLLQQIPQRYRRIFADGCHKAMTQAAPARFSGAFDYDFQAELYRGCSFLLGCSRPGRNV